MSIKSENKSITQPQKLQYLRAKPRKVKNKIKTPKISTFKSFRKEKSGLKAELSLVCKQVMPWQISLGIASTGEPGRRWEVPRGAVGWLPRQAGCSGAFTTSKAQKLL